MTVIVTNRSEPLVDENGLPSLRFAELLEQLTDTLNTLTSNTNAYTVTNATIDRAYDANQAAGTISATPTQAEVENLRDAILELADVQATVIVDLQNVGIVP